MCVRASGDDLASDERGREEELPVGEVERVVRREHKHPAPVASDDRGGRILDGLFIEGENRLASDR